MSEGPSIETKVAVMENRLIDTNESLAVANRSIEKLTEISGSLKEIIAVHENRLVQREKTDIHIFELIEKRTEQFDRGIEKATERAEELNKQVQDLLRESIDAQSENLEKMFNEMRAEQKLYNENIDKRVSQLERWRWIMIGAGIAVGLLAGQLGQIGTLIAHLFSL